MSSFTDNNKLKVIVDSIQDSDFKDFPYNLQSLIEEYINEDEHTIHDMHNKRTMLSWAAESEKLHIFEYLLTNHAMNEDTTDTWPALLETSNESLKKLQDSYKKDLAKYKLLMNEYLDFIREITKGLQNDIQTRIIADIQNSIKPNGGELEDDTIDTLQGIEITARQDGKQADILGRLDQFGSHMQNKDRILHETIEVNEFIKKRAGISEAKSLSVAASHMKKPPPLDAVMHVASFILPNKDTIKKIGENYINNINKRSITDSSNSNQKSLKRQKLNGGKKKSKRKSKRKSKKNLKKASRKCRK